METSLEFGLVFLLCFGIACQALTLSTYVTPADKERYKAKLLASSGDGLAVLEKTAVGLSVLGVALPEPDKICKTIKQKLTEKKKDDVESLYYAAFLTKKLADSGAKCDASLADAEATFSEAIKTAANSQSILYSTAGLSFLGRQIDSAKVTAALDAAIKADDSPLSIAYALKAASFLKGDLKKYHDLIEDVIAQSDEVDDKYAQFEGGFIVTAKVIDAAYKLSQAAGLAPTVTEDKVVKFANYFLSRKHTESKEEIGYLLEVIQSLTTNKFHIPVAVSLASSVSVSEKSPLVAVRVTDLLGNNLGKLTVTADTARHLGDDAVVLSKKPFTASASDASLFELELMKAKPIFGFYWITISVVSQQPQKEPKLLGTSGAEVEVKVVIQAAVDSVDITVADKEQNSVTKSSKIQHPNKIALEADYHQRLTVRFTVLDKVAGKAMEAHQTFVRLTNTKTKQEVIFVAEEDTAKAYKFELDVGAKAKDFNSLSGKYTLDLIVGDAVIENPIMWTLADIQLTFHDEITPSTEDQYRYSKKPEIKHLFREPEKRPPAFVSNLFTALLIVPVIILFGLWLKIGVNISNFPFTISAVGFHVGLTAIFALYTCYFLKLNMFTTLRYLGIIGIPTFLFGQKLLSLIAARSSRKH